MNVMTIKKTGDRNNTKKTMYFLISLPKLRSKQSSKCILEPLYGFHYKHVSNDAPKMVWSKPTPDLTWGLTDNNLKTPNFVGEVNTFVKYTISYVGKR